MALAQLQWSLFLAKALVCSLLVLPFLYTATGMSGWDGCLDGQDVFTTIRENSHSGEVVAEIMAETTMEGVHWSLNGKDADWFFLDEGSIRLNTSADKVLDREAQGPVLMAELSCYEDDALQSVYRILVEVLDENDNLPVFAKDMVQSLSINELTPVNTTVFTVQAKDADNDKIIYSIDQASPDAEYFKVDLPNSGQVILAKPLDYETKTLLTVTIYASEMNTAERFNASTTMTINILDGDDQYPQFVPCNLLFQDKTSHICTSPLYTVNVTEVEEDIVLDFSPGPIQAVDGDRGLGSPLSYAIISGNDGGCFLMDRETGEVKMICVLGDRLTTPELHLQVMAYQDDDPRKYSVATVLVRVLAVNQFYPEFDTAEYQGFVTAGKTTASLVNTYGSKALVLKVQDRDFNHGFNPMIHFTFSPKSNHTEIYQITQEGLLIARTNKLRPKQIHLLEVMARDQESGEATVATVVVEVLPEGQSIPNSSLGDAHPISCTLGKGMFLSVVFMSFLGCTLSVVVWLKRKHKGKRNPLQRGCVAQGKHPNVSLRWFQLVSHRSGMPHTEKVHRNEEFGTCNPSFTLLDNPVINTHQDLTSYQGPVALSKAAAPDTSFMPTDTVASPLVVTNDDSTQIKCSSWSPTFHQAPVDVILTRMAPPKVNPGSVTDLTDAPPDVNPSPVTPDGTITPPDSQTTETTAEGEAADPDASPSSQCSIPCSHTRIASAEIDKPFRKLRVKTPPYSPLLSSLLPSQTGTPPSTPERAPIKAMFVHIETSPHDTPPPVTPQPTSMTQSTELDQPSTSMDPMEGSGRPGGASDGGSPSHDRRPSTNMGNRLPGEGKDDDGFLEDKDADKNNEDDDSDELDPDDEELLRVMARCNPIFITFRK
ncbi:cadherin-related family member 5 isoform 1-T2 [Spinachia spinachia]